MAEDSVPKARRPIEIQAEAEPVKLGSMLLTVVEPHRGHEVAYNRWYERDHFYSGCMVGPYNFAGRRFVATADLKALRDPDPSVITGEPDPRARTWRSTGCSTGTTTCGNAGPYVRSMPSMRPAACSKSATTSTRCCTTSTGHYRRRTPDGVPVEIALDHPYRGFVPVFIDRADDITNEDLWAWLRSEHLPGLLPGTDADLVAAFTPIALEVDAPGDVPRESAKDNRTVLLWFLNSPPEVAWEPVIAEHRRRLEAAGKGTVVAALPFIPTIPGTDTYTDRLWS